MKIDTGRRKGCKYCRRILKIPMQLCTQFHWKRNNKAEARGQLPNIGKT